MTSRVRSVIIMMHCDDETPAVIDSVPVTNAKGELLALTMDDDGEAIGMVTAVGWECNIGVNWLMIDAQAKIRQMIRGDRVARIVSEDVKGIRVFGSGCLAKAGDPEPDVASVPLASGSSILSVDKGSGQ